jgi:predicted Zn-dependent protease with MMP-like domain
MDDEEFGGIVDKAVSDLPEDIKKQIENVAIVIADYPSDNQLGKFFKRGDRGTLLGLYEGIPKTKRVNYGIGGPLPDKITIFKIPLLQISNSYEDAIKNIKDTVIHELGHHFGMTDEEILNAKK